MKKLFFLKLKYGALVWFWRINQILLPFGAPAMFLIVVYLIVFKYGVVPKRPPSREEIIDELQKVNGYLQPLIVATQWAFFIMFVLWLFGI